MSMNIHVCATAMVKAKNGKEFEYRRNFDCWQTPTADTYNILEAEDKIKAYKDWVMATSHEEFVDEYEDYEDDVAASYGGLGGGRKKPLKPPVKVRYHYGEIHCKELDDFIAEETAKGCKIEMFDM